MFFSTKHRKNTELAGSPRLVLKSKVPVFLSQGFTLLELLIVSIISTTVVLTAGASLISILDWSLTQQTDLDQQNKINATLFSIAEDIRSAQQIQTDIPQNWSVPSGLQELFFVKHANGNWIGFYTRLATDEDGWQGPRLLLKATESNSEGAVIADAIANQIPSSSNPSCTGSNTGGLEFAPFPLDSTDREVNLCLIGNLSNQSAYTAQSKVALRGQ